VCEHEIRFEALFSSIPEKYRLKKPLNLPGLFPSRKKKKKV